MDDGTLQIMRENVAFASRCILLVHISISEIFLSRGILREAQSTCIYGLSLLVHLVCNS